MATTCKLIAKVELSSSGATIDFTSIPGTYTDLYLVASLRSDRAGNTWDPIRIRFNGAANDTNHSDRFLQGNGASASSGTGSRCQLGQATAATATSSTFGSGDAYIPNYAGSAKKSFSATGVNETNATTAFIEAHACLWDDTSAITAISLQPVNGSNWVSGSSAFLYGITKS